MKGWMVWGVVLFVTGLGLSAENNLTPQVKIKETGVGKEGEGGGVGEQENRGANGSGEEERTGKNLTSQVYKNIPRVGREGKKAGEGKEGRRLEDEEESEGEFQKQEARGDGNGGSGVTVEAAVDRALVTVGDEIQYTLTIRSDPGVEVDRPGTGVNLGQFEIRDYHEVEEKADEKGRRVYTVEYVVAIYETGRFEIPPVEVKYRVGGQERSVRSQPLKIEVKSVQSGKAEDIRDVKGPEMLPVSYRRPILLAGGFLGGLLLLGGGIWWRRRRLGRSNGWVLEEPPRPPHEVALERLAALAEGDWLETGRIKEFHSELSDVVRRYLEGRFGVEALERTTERLIPDLPGAGVKAEHIALTEELLSECDLVKFAKYIPPRAESEAQLEAARRLVRETMIAEEEERPDVPAEEESQAEPAMTEEGEREE